MGWYERWQGWTERHRFLVDLTWTVLLGLLALVMSTDMYSSGPTTQAMIISASVLAPMPWCRTRPVVSCALVFVACMVHMTFLGVPVVLPADLVVLVSLYCVTVYGPRWSYLAAGGAAVVGVLTLGISGWINFGSSLAHGIPTMIGAGSLLATAFALGLVRRSRRLMMEALRDRAERLEIERDQQAQIATAAERARIAREMHDIVAHSVGIIALQAGAAARVVHTQPDAAREAMSAVETAGRETLSGLRRMLGALREAGPGQEPSGREHAPLRPADCLADVDRLARVTTAAGVRVDVEWRGERRVLPPELELSAFRVIQESVTNVVRHAETDACRVRVAYGPEELAVEITDRGRGAGRGTSPGFGLAGMRERVALLHGEFTAAPVPGGGFRVTARLPVPACEPAREAISGLPERGPEPVREGAV